jgi:hypothetical protein
MGGKFNNIASAVKAVIQNALKKKDLILTKNNPLDHIIYKEEVGEIMGYKICKKSTADYWFNSIDKYKKLENVGSIAVVGHGSSGSSAVYDYLMEFRGVIRAGPTEYRFIKERGGLIDLELMWENWSHWNCKAAVDDFRYIMKMHFRKMKYIWLLGEHFCIVGLGDGRKQPACVDEFINDISLFDFNGYWFVDKNEGVLNNIKRYISYKLNKSNFTVLSPSINFQDKSKMFLKNLVEDTALSDNYEYCVFDQLVDPANILKCNNYFDNLRTIVVVRDPRDQFISFCKTAKGFAPTTVDNFCLLYKENMKSIDVDDSIIIVRFEDFVFNFERESLRIKKLLDLSDEDHLKSKYHFDKDKSALKIGKWKSYHDQLSMNTIEKKLKEFCYEIK